MNILALDTSMAACSAAVLLGGGEGRISARFEPMDRGHAEALFPMIEAVMAEAGLGFADLNRIAVTRGPGSFTGVRAGIAAARGLALGCGAEVVGAGSLELMARASLERLSEAERERGFLIAQDARRGELYIQLFGRGGEAVTEPAVAALDEAAGLAAACGLVAGSGGHLVVAEAARSGRTVAARLPDLLPDAAHLARLAVHLPAPGGPVTPLYLRPPDAKPQTDKALARV